MARKKKTTKKAPTTPTAPVEATGPTGPSGPTDTPTGATGASGVTTATAPVEPTAPTDTATGATGASAPTVKDDVVDGQLGAITGILDEVVENYASNIPQDKDALIRLARTVGTALNHVLSAQDYPTFKKSMDLVRTYVRDNPKGSFDKNRIIGHMMDASTGMLYVGSNNILALFTIITNTSAVDQFEAVQGQIDLSEAIDGLTAQQADYLVQYYGH